MQIVRSLNSWDIRSYSHVALFDDVRHYFILQYTGVFIVHIHAELSFPNSRSPSFTANGLKAEENAHTRTATL